MRRSYRRRRYVGRLLPALLLAALLPGFATASPPTGDAPGLRVFASRSPASTRLDATLTGVLRGLPQVRAARALSDLHELNPAVRWRQSALSGEPLVLIDATTLGDPQRLLSALTNLGLEQPAMYANDVGGWLPVRQLGAAAARAELHAMRAALMRTRAGTVNTQGDFVQGTAALRAGHSLTGSGITVGVLSDSFDCYATYAMPGSGVPAAGYNGYAPNGFLATAASDAAGGDLPATVHVLKEADCLNYGAPDQLPFADEGRALLQIVHDVAPGAALAFYTGYGSEADFASGIGKLATAGARVIADDVGYYDEPFFQDGIVAQAIDAAAASGVAYFSAAGNEGATSYDNPAPAFTSPSGSAFNQGEQLLNFDTTGASNTTTLSISVPPLYPGSFFALVLQWDQPFVTGAPQSGGARSQLDLCVTGAAASPPVFDGSAGFPNCTGPNATGVDPVQILIIGNPANATGPSAAETIGIQVGLAAGSAAPGRLKLALDGDGLAIGVNNTFVPAATPTLQGHPTATGALAVGAAAFWNSPACGVSPARLEPYSSRGGEPILFDASGHRLSAPEQRTKPDVVDADGVYTTFFGTPISQTGFTDPSTLPGCADTDRYPSFFGTSAATPHAAGAAALYLQYNPALSPAQIQQALRASAAPMAGAAPNDDSGYGFVQAEQALAQLPAPSSPSGVSPLSGSPGSGGSPSSGGGAFDAATLLLLSILAAARIIARERCPTPQRVQGGAACGSICSRASAASRR